MIRRRRSAEVPGLLVTGTLLFLATVYLGGIIMSAGALGLGFDFRFQYYDGASAIVHGQPLYTSASDPALEVGKAYVYPPPLAAALTPVTLLSRDTATLLAILGSLAAIWAALAVVGVGDIRCYAAVVLTAPVWNVLETANVTALLTLALALAWRFRSTVWPLAAVLGVALATKLFLFPVGVWTLATRRYGVTVRLVVVATATLAVTWAAAGFQGLRQYPDMVARLSEIHASSSYSVVGMASALGIDSVVAHLISVAAGGLFLGLCFVFARRSDDMRAFTCAVIAALALTPILWQHYLCLLLVPLGIARPRFSVIWLLPAVLWIAPRVGHGEGVEPFLPALVVAGMTIAILAPPMLFRLRPKEATA